MRHRRSMTQIGTSASPPTRRMVWPAVTVLSSLTWVGHAQAALIAQFTGTVTNVPASLSGGFDVDESITAFYRFDETTPDTSGGSNFGIYPAIDNYEVQFSGGYTASATAGEINVSLPATGGHRYRVVATANVSGPDVSGLALTGIFLTLEDSSRTAFSSPALPTDLDLDDFDTRRLALIFGEQAVEVEVTGLAIVPEPVTASLIALGVVAIGACGRRFTTRPARRGFNLVS